MNKEFIQLISEWRERFMAAAVSLSITYYNRKSNIKKSLFKDPSLENMIEELFTDGIRASNKVMRRDVVKLSNILEVPFKYDKSVIETINGRSLYTGFYDNNTKVLWKRREIDRLKRVILTGKYSGWSEARLIQEIRDTVNITVNRARVIGRMETQRLEGAAQQIFYQQKRVRDEYEKVYVSLSDARPSHKALDGQVADEEGYFTATDGSKFLYPPPPTSPFGCRCTSVLRKRKEDDKV